MSNIRKKKVQIPSWITILILVGISSYAFMTYVKYTNYRKNAIKITYTISSYEKHSGGRGSYYTSEIFYNNRAYNIDITEGMYDSMQNGNIPTLYYNVNNGVVLTDWDVLKRKRISIIIAIFTSILVVLEYGKYVKSMIFKK